MKRSRREFIRKSGIALGSAAFAATFNGLGRLNALAQKREAERPNVVTGYKALVCIFMFGGNDANNMVVPYDGYAGYSTARGAMALSQASLLQVTAPSHGSLRFGLHPNLTAIHPLYAQNKLAVLCNMGTLVAPMTKAQYLNGSVRRPDNLFSHEDQQQQGQTSVSANTLLNEPIGWGGRLADQSAFFNGGNGFPMLISPAGAQVFGVGVGSRPLVPGPNLSGFGSPITNDQRYLAMRYLMTVDNTAILNDSQSELMERAIDNNTILNNALNTASVNTVFPSTGLGNQLRQVARIIAARSTIGLNRQVFFCSIGGFDTHSDQMSLHSTLMTNLGAAMKAFYDATVELGVQSQVTTFTMSDFSRTMRPNQTGTDHAWGAHQFIMGDAVQGGNFYGTYPDITLNGPSDADNYGTNFSNGRWIPTTSIDQYGATLAQWFDLDPALRGSVFPNIGSFPAQTLPFMG